MRHLLDTNTVSAAMVGDPIVLGRLRRCSRGDVLLPQPVLAEIAFGLAALPKSKKRETLSHKFDLIKQELARAVWDDEVSQAFGRIKAALKKKGALLEDFDVAIAAHAIAYNATLVTRNLRHMQRVPELLLEDWSVP